MPDTHGNPSFKIGGCPRRPGVPLKPLNATCCDEPICPPRDYNRNALLLFDKMTAAYAALCLLRYNTARVWHCDEEGHSDDCPHPACKFGGEMVTEVDGMIAAYEAAIKRVFRGLTKPAIDLGDQWADLGTIEGAAVRIDEASDLLDASSGEAFVAAVRIASGAIAFLQSEATEGDPTALTGVGE